MNIIEPHIHMFSRTTDDYTAMYNAGIRVCVEPSFWLGSDRRYAGSFFDYYRIILEFETVRAARFGIDHFAAISVNPKEAENLPLVDEVIAGLDEYLIHPRCVAVGEIGLNLNTQNEIKTFTKQLLIAEKRKMPVIIHLPHVPKAEGAKIITEIIKAEGVTQNRIIIDHNDEKSMPVSRKTDCYTGMTVYPHSKLNPERVNSLIKEFGVERMIVDGSADWGVSDPLSLLKVVEYLRGKGHGVDTVKKLVHDNANAFYSQSPNWKPNFNLQPLPISSYQR